MKIIKSTYRHKYHREYAAIAEFQATVRDVAAYRDMCTAFEQCYGPSRQLNERGIWQRNPRWHCQGPTAHNRKQRRIYFQNIKDWQWATLAIPNSP